MNVYVFHGTDSWQTEQYLNKFIKDSRLEKEQVISFDAGDVRNFNIDQAIMELNTMSLFEEDRKCVILNQPYFLRSSAKDGAEKTSEKDKSRHEHITQVLESYMKNPDPSNILVFVCKGYSADSRKKEYKVLEKYHARMEKFDALAPWNFPQYINDQLKKNRITLSPEARKELERRVGADKFVLHNAISNILLYGEKNLSLEDIRHIVPLNPEVNIWELGDAFIASDMTRIIRARDEMYQFNYNPSDMIPMLAGHIRRLYNMKALQESGLSVQQIIVRLKLRQKEYAVQKTLETVRRYKAKQLLTYLSELADLDQGIKAGVIDPFEGFDQFILRNGNGYAGN